MSPSPDKVRIAFFAVGGIARFHLETIAKRDDVVITAMCDLSDAALDTARTILSTQYTADQIASIRVTKDAMEMAADVDCDCAFLSIPNPKRIPVAERLISRGIPLLMEKPAAHTLEDFDKLLVAQRKSGSMVMVSQNYRFKNGAMLVRRLLKENQIGEVETINGCFLRNHRMASRLYYGTLPGSIPFRIEMIIHHIDLVAFWLGAAPNRIVADGFRTPTSWGVGDTGCDILARFDNGARLNYHGDWSAAASETGWNGHWLITGSQGILIWHGENLVQLKHRHSDPFRDDGDCVDFRTSTEEDSIGAVHSEFLSALREGRTPESSLEENASPFRLCLEAAAQSALAN